MSVQDEQFMRRTITRLARRGRAKVRPRVRKGTGSGHGSRTLAAAIRVEIARFNVAHISIPHYWAIYVHDGRGPFGPKRQGFYVWFRDPKQDPRLNRGHGWERLSQKRRLTRSEFQAGLAMNHAHLDRGGSPRSLPMIITKQIRRGMKPNKFFSNAPRGGMFGFKREADKIIGEDFDKYVLRRLKPVLNLRGVIPIRL